GAAGADAGAGAGAGADAGADAGAARARARTRARARARAQARARTRARAGDVAIEVYLMSPLASFWRPSTSCTRGFAGMAVDTRLSVSLWAACSRHKRPSAPSTVACIDASPSKDP